MKKLYRVCTFILLLTLMLTLTPVDSVFAQDPDTPNAPEVPEFQGDPAQYADAPEEEPIEAAAPEFILASPPLAMNYMGYVTDGSGNPLTGQHGFIVSLWDDETAGTREWGPEFHPNTPVNNGLFNLVLGATEILQPSVFDEALFLKVIVDGTELPRQPLRPSAYAFGLVPGAEVQGKPLDNGYTLEVINDDPDASGGSGLYSYGTKDGIMAAGVRYGISADSYTADGIGVYTADWIKAKGYISTRDSTYFTAGMEGDFQGSAINAIKHAQYTGRADLKSSAGTQTVYFYIPLHVPAILYGQEVTAESITVHYWTTNANTRILHTLVRKQLNHGWSETVLASNTTDRTSTTPSSYTLTLGGENQLAANEGILLVRFQVRLADPSHTLAIGGVSVRIGHP